MSQPPPPYKEKDRQTEPESPSTNHAFRNDLTISGDNNTADQVGRNRGRINGEGNNAHQNSSRIEEYLILYAAALVIVVVVILSQPSSRLSSLVRWII